jgi:hypothetical protein
MLKNTPLDPITIWCYAVNSFTSNYFRTHFNIIISSLPLRNFEIKSNMRFSSILSLLHFLFVL